MSPVHAEWPGVLLARDGVARRETDVRCREALKSVSPDARACHRWCEVLA